MSKKKSLDKGKSITIYLEESHLLHIQRIAHKMSIESNETISVCKAIRIALQEVYPNPKPKQIELFPEVKKRRVNRKKKAKDALAWKQESFAF